MTQQELAAHETDPNTTHPIAPALPIGVGGALMLGVVSWILLLIDRNMPSLVLALGCGVSYLLWITLAFRRVPAQIRSKSGLLAGLTAAGLSFTFWGAIGVHQSATIEALQAQDSAFESGDHIRSAGIGITLIVLTVIGAKLAPKRASIEHGLWKNHLAMVVAASYLPLIMIGGVVTSTESGLAVPDAFTTYGSFGVLFPLSLMDNIRIYLEHSHRIFGTFSGLATITLMLAMLVSRANKAPKVLSVLLLIAVIAQGVMGALRVSEVSQYLAALHGVLAQLVFALAATTAVMSIAPSSNALSEQSLKLARGARTVALITGIALIIQLVFGSLTRHTESAHPLMAHVGFSFVVVVLCIVAGAKLIVLGKAEDTPQRPKKLGVLIHGIVILQFTLGWGALAMTRTGKEGHRPIPTHDQLETAHAIHVPETIIAGAHHMLGALLLGALVAGLVWSIRLALSPKSE